MRILNTIYKILNTILFWRNLKGKKRAYFQVLLGAILVVLVPLALSTFRNPEQAKAAWFDDNFTYRQNVALTNSGSAQTDFQVMITLDTATLITAGKMQSDCDDIRIIDLNSKLLSYWIETGTNACNTTTTAIWTKVPAINTTGNTLYLYYGNPSAASAQNGNSVFEYFDDFSTNTASNYTITSGSVSVSGGILTVTGVAAGNGVIAPTSQKTLSSYVVEARAAYTNKGAGDDLVGVLGFQSTVGSSNTGYVAQYGDVSSAQKVDVEKFTTSHLINTAITFTEGTYYLIKGAFTSGTIKATFQRTTDATASNSDYTSGSYGLRTFNADGTYDFWFVRKYAATEPTVAAPASEEKAPSPVAYWKFDDGTGTTAQDSTTNNNDGTLTSGPTWQTEDQCVSGKCLFFDGTNDHVLMTSAPTTGTGSFSAFAWVRTTDTGARKQIFMWGNDAGTSNDGAWLFINTSNQLAFDLSNVAGATSTTTITDGKWHFVGVVNSANTIQLYIDGKADGSSVSMSPNLGSTYKVIGKKGSTDTWFFKGFIDEPKIYNYARSAAQVLTDYNSRGSVKGASSTIGSDPQNNAAALSNGLVGYWKLEETATPSLDSSGNGRSGTWNGNVDDVVGKFGNGMTFDGTGDYASMGDVLDFERTDPFTMAYWVKTASGAEAEFVIAKWDNNVAGEGYGSSLSASGYPTFHLANHQTTSAIDVTGNISARDNTWHHVVVTYDGSSTGAGVKIYTDGVLNTSTIDRDNLSATTVTAESFQLGCREGCTFSDFNGTMDEVRIYNRALSSAEASALYNFAPGPVGYWKMDENTGTSANDASGNANTGSISGATWTSGKFGSSLNYDGTDDVTTVTNATAIDLNTAGAHTFESWVYADTAGEGSGGQVYQKGATTYLRVDTLSGSNLDVEASLDLATTDATLNISTAITTSTWNHIVVTYDDDADDEITIYINGVNRGSSTNGVGSIAADANNLLIGGTTTDNFDGKIDDFRFFDYARSAKQITEDMNAGHPAPGSPVGSAVGYWKFDEGYSTTANNSGSQGSTLQGSLSGMASPATSTSGWTNSGKFGKALSFDGTDDFVNIGDLTALKITGNITLSAWINTTATPANYREIIAKWSTGGVDASYLLGVHASGPLFCINNSSNSNVCSTSTQTVHDGAWHHLIGTYDGSTTKLYIDGLLVDSDTQTGAISNTTLSARIGNDANGNPDRLWSGKIDEPKIYNYALTADQVKIDMNRGQAQVLGALSDNSSYQVQAANQEYCIPGDSTSCASPVGEWKFDENQGTSANDTSGNANTGTLTNSPTWSTGKIGSAISMAGGTEYTEVTSRSNLDGTTFTVEGWIYLNDVTATNQWLIWNAKVGSQWGGWGLVINRSTVLGCDVGEICFWISDNVGGQDYVEVTHNLTENKRWYHIAATWNNSTKTATYYVDGKLLGSAVSAASITFGASPKTYIGDADDLSYSFNGKIDQLRVFNYARSAAQVAWDYNKGGPVGHWKFDECQGTTAYDSSTTGSGASNGNTGTITIGASGTQTSAGTCTGSANTAWKDGATGKYNSSLDFDGTDDKVTITRTAALEPTNVTLSAWVKMSSSTPTQVIIGKKGHSGGSASYGLILRSGATRITFTISSSAGTEYHASSTNFATGVWQHWVGTYDGTTQKLYLNGVLQDTQTPGIAISYTTASDLEMGTYNGGSFPFPGQIDDVKIFNYALTATQVKGLMNDGALRFGPVTGTP